MRLLELCSGTGVLSQEARRRGWDAVEIDLVGTPILVADVRALPLKTVSWDFVWASPPCTEYSREDQPWSRTGREPDHSIWQACWHYIVGAHPRFWCIENVRGAQRYFGQAPQHCGSRYLWTNLPHIACPVRCYGKEKYGPSPDRPRLRSKLPQPLVESVMHCVTEALHG